MGIISRYVYGLWALSRPLFLLGIVPLYTMGAAAAWYDKKMMHVPQLISGLILVWLVQLTTHYNNEYYDLETDLATKTPTRISGGSRVLVNNLVPRNTARVAAVICLILAIVLAISIVLILRTGLVTLALAAPAIILGWFYSAKPLKLESADLGEIDIAVVSCFLVPLTGYYLETSTIRLFWLMVCLPPFLITLALITSTEMLDYVADKATGKKTWVVRMGTRKAMQLSVATLLLGWIAFLAILLSFQPIWGWVLIGVSLPLILYPGFSLMSFLKTGILDVKKMERTGLVISLLIGYTGICLTLALLLR